MNSLIKLSKPMECLFESRCFVWNKKKETRVHKFFPDLIILGTKKKFREFKRPILDISAKTTSNSDPKTQDIFLFFRLTRSPSGSELAHACIILEKHILVQSVRHNIHLEHYGLNKNYTRVLLLRERMDPEKKHHLGSEN